MRWTKEQESILFEHGNKGAEYCARLIAKKYRVIRSPESTRRHANRIGASMMTYEVCPRCGTSVRKLNRNSGLCETCNLRSLTDRLQQIKKTLRGGDLNAYLQAKRNYDRERQAVSREKRRCGDFVDLSEKMSFTSSEATKNFAFEPGNEPEKEMRALA